MQRGVGISENPVSSNRAALYIPNERRLAATSVAGVEMVRRQDGCRRRGRCRSGEEAACGLTGRGRPRIVWPKMPSHATTKEIAARSPLSGRPVGAISLFAFSLLGLLLILLAR